MVYRSCSTRCCFDWGDDSPDSHTSVTVGRCRLSPLQTCGQAPSTCPQASWPERGRLAWSAASRPRRWAAGSQIPYREPYVVRWAAPHRSCPAEGHRVTRGSWLSPRDPAHDAHQTPESERGREAQKAGLSGCLSGGRRGCDETFLVPRRRTRSAPSSRPRDRGPRWPGRCGWNRPTRSSGPSPGHGRPARPPVPARLARCSRRARHGRGAAPQAAGRSTRPVCVGRERHREGSVPLP